MNIIDNDLYYKQLDYRNITDRIVYHDADASICSIEDIHQWHLQNGWAGCGYHFLVRKDGSIHRGRPENAVGSHCLHSNLASIGICAEGKYMVETMPQVQLNSLIELGIYLKNKYDLNQVYGHRELYSTDCPGTNYPLDTIKEGIKSEVLNNTVQEEEKKMKSLVVYAEGADKRAAEYLADYLKCPICNKENLTQDTVNSTMNIYMVGGTMKPTDKAVLIAGANRFDTMGNVLKAIKIVSDGGTL